MIRLALILWPTLGAAISTGVMLAFAATQITWPAETFADRAATIAGGQALSVHTDLTLLIGAAISAIPGLNAGTGLGIASALGMPIAAAVAWGLPSPTQNRGALAVALPLSAGLVVAGIGLLVPASYFMWRALLTVPAAPPRQGMAVAGLGIGVGYAAIPGFAHALLPLAAVLFVFAPKEMLRAHMRVFYLLAFAPAAMIAGSYGYAAAVLGPETWAGAPVAGPLAASVPAPAAMVFLASFLAVSGAFLGVRRAALPAHLCIAFTTVVAATAAAAPVLPLIGQAALGHAATAQRWAAPPWTIALGVAGGMAVLVGLDRV